MLDKKFIVSSIFASILVVVGVFVWYVSNYNPHAIESTAECTEIFKQKSPGYFDGVGKSRFIFSKRLNTCLILNTVDYAVTGEYKIYIVDMITDSILFVYELGSGQEKDETLGLTKEEALNKVREFGFVVF